MLYITWLTILSSYYAGCDWSVWWAVFYLMACKNVKIFSNPSNTCTNNEYLTNLVISVGTVKESSFPFDLSIEREKNPVLFDIWWSSKTVWTPSTKICQAFAFSEQASEKANTGQASGISLSLFFLFFVFQVFHCHFNSNFFPLFLDKLLGDSISPQTGAILLGVSFVAPHINNLYFLSLCRRFGVYSVIKWLFYVKLGLSVIMLMVGPNWPILLCFYIAR